VESRETLLLGLLYPDALAKMTSGGNGSSGGNEVIEIASSAINPSNRNAFDAFIKKMRSLEGEITESRCNLHDVQTLQSLSEQLAERHESHRFQSGGNMPNYLCNWLCDTMKYHGMAAQIDQKRAQYKEMGEELEVAKRIVAEAEAASGLCGGIGDVSATQIKAVQEEASKTGTHAPTLWVRWALQRSVGDESAATALLAAQPEARKALAALRNPGASLLVTAEELSTVTPHTVRRVRMNLRRSNVRRLVENCVEATEVMNAVGEYESEVLRDANTSTSELLLFRWAVAVCDYVEASARTQPQQQKVILLERRLEEKQRALEQSLHHQRKEARVQAHREELPIELFPALEPWKHFPWEAHFLPRSDAEEQLRAAVGLRDLPLIEQQLVAAVSAGLSRTNSRVTFEALELRDLLRAQAAMEAAAVKAARVSSANGMITLTDNSSSSDEETATVPTPPPITREKTQDILERLGTALNVFVEPVATDVPSGLPKPQPFVEVLRKRAEQFESFIVLQRDVNRRGAILSIVSNAVGVTDIETEQCREQEQEKAQEQEQEQEIEMERYVDMAYQRDNEEPKRWAFCTLGESKDGKRIHDPDGESRVVTSALAPFSSGAFYPAHEFKLHGRAPLPFSSCLAISRNHFNLEWTGERRLKNAVCVLEWIPAVAQLERVGRVPMPLTDEQNGRLDAALDLLDIRGDGTFGAAEISQVLRAAEHTEPDEVAIATLLSSKPTGTLTKAEVRDLLVNGAFRKGDSGRHFVLVSLAEAETIRCILHMRQGKVLIDGAEVALALRCIPAHDAVFDQTSNYTSPTTYQKQISHQSFRFLDSSMHFRPSELNVLLRSLPAPPAARRLFFSTVVACRRRLAKRWEQTPLSKLFTLDDEWSMLQLEALRVRMREAVKARGLLPHDAFLLFDHDDDGVLSLIEVLGAFKWLNLDSAGLHLGLAFVRSLSRLPQISYGAFIELLSEPEAEEAAEGDNGAHEEVVITTAPTAIVPTAPESLISGVCNDHEMIAELNSLWAEGIASERQLDEQLELEMAAQAERSRLFVEQQLLDCDFSWMRTQRPLTAGGHEGRRPHTTRTTCFYDFTRGVTGGHKGAPLWMEGRGRWLHVKQGSSRVPTLKAHDRAFLVLRVPFRKSGGGTYCNTWTVSLMVKFHSIGSRHLLSTGGWDQFTQMQEGDDHAQWLLSDDGSVGALNTFTSEGGGGGSQGGRLKESTWHAISISVDAVVGVVRTYIDGEEAVTVRSPKICKDGQFALKGRLALFYGGGRGASCGYYLRSATVHNRALDGTQITKEHSMLHELLLTDAIAAAPSALRPTLEGEGAPSFTSPTELKSYIRELKASGSAKATELWRALLVDKPTSASILTLTNQMASHDLAIGARCAFEVKSGCVIEESEAPYGESLLHAAAYVGNCPLVAALLTAGASPCKRGLTSGCTPLHSAASAGHEGVCEQLLTAGANASVLTSATKRSALHFACLKSHSGVARLLVAKGGADPYMSGGQSCESVMALLRKRGRVEDLTLLSELDELCSKQPVGEAAAAAAGVEPLSTSNKDEEKEEGDGMSEYDSEEDDEGGDEGGGEEEDDEYEEDEDGEE